MHIQSYPGSESVAHKLGTGYARRPSVRKSRVHTVSTQCIRLVAVLLFAACGDSGDSGTTPTTTTTSPTTTSVATSVTLSPTTLNFSTIGATLQITATVTDQDGSTMSDASVTWSTSSASIATVSSSGLVTAVAAGNATITAASGSANGTATVEVFEEPPPATAEPNTEIESGPATGSIQRDSEAAFSFFGDQPGSTFECRLDGATWSTCGATSEGNFISTVGYTGLGEGEHTFEVRATNEIGTDLTPASRSWSVDTTGNSGILSLVSSTAVTGADLWSGLSYDGSHILLTTMMSGQINLVKYTTELVQVGDPVALTTGEDIPAGKNIADHKHLLIGSTLYVAWSPSGDEDLYIFRTDTNGTRLGSQEIVVESSSVMTNDMHLFTDGSSVFVMYAEAGADRHVVQYSTSLAREATRLVTAPSPHDPLGATLYQNGGYRMFGGNGINRHLIVANWTSDWTTQDPYELVIVPSTTDDWNWFASGVAWDPTDRRWFIGYRHMESGEDANTQGSVRLAVFNENYELLDRVQLSGSPWFRPHFLLEGGHLYVSYDNQNDEVHLSKYSIAPPGTD